MKFETQYVTIYSLKHIELINHTVFIFALLIYTELISIYLSYYLIITVAIHMQMLPTK